MSDATVTALWSWRRSCPVRRLRGFARAVHDVKWINKKLTQKRLSLVWLISVSTPACTAQHVGKAWPPSAPTRIRMRMQRSCDSLHQKSTSYRRSGESFTWVYMGWQPDAHGQLVSKLSQDLHVRILQN